MISLPPSEPPTGISRREWRRRVAGASTPESTQSSGPLPGLFASTESSAARPEDARPTILTVCTGNICRSPMAEILLRRTLEPLGVHVHSAGTQALVDYGMPQPAQEMAISLGADAGIVDAHRARYLIEPMLQQADLILTMSREHRSRAVQMMPRSLRRVFTIREFARLASTLSTEDARAAADAAGSDPRERLRAVALAVADQRGLSEPVADEDDVIDPYRRSQEIYEQSAAEMTPAVAEVDRIVRAALG